MDNSIELTQIGRYDSGIFDEGAAEITTYDPASQSLFVINGAENTIDVLDVSDPTNPTFNFAINIEDFGAGINSIDIRDGVVAAAFESDPAQDPGKIVFFDTEGNVLNQVTVGALPDMVTFTPDGTKLLVANEGEPNEDDPSLNPEGSISIIDVSNGVESTTVTTADFTAYNGREAELRGRGVRIFPGETFANDVEPEYITVSPDSSQAFVALQENNAIAVVDLEAGEISDVQPLGLKDYSRGLPQLTNYPWDLSEEVLGTTPAGQEILLGGLSGLYYEGETDDDKLQFIATPDRGPNGEPTDVDGDGENERPFPLPDYQAQLIRFTLDRESGEFKITEEIPLTRDGHPITGLPNLQAGEPGTAYTDESPVDLFGEPLDNDRFGADLESVVVAPDGSFWLSDEYRPAIYHFDPHGELIDRFIPEGTAEAVGHPEGTFGKETLPEVYAQRRANRGFEGMALNSDNGNLYAFIQSPLDNPDVSNAEADAADQRSDYNSRNSQVLRILEVDPTTGEPVGEYVYFLEGSPGVDKIGDAVYAGDGKFYVIERDSGTDADSEKFIFEVDLTGATNILGTDLATATGEDTALESMTPDDLAEMEIQPVTKTQVLNLPSIGYLAGDKPEGLALLPNGSLAVINDNDFGLLDEEIPGDGSVPFNPDPVPTVLGIIDFNQPNGLDASDTDGIDISNQPVYGLYQPDAIAAYEADGATYYVTANEGDARDEDERVADLELDPTAFPNAEELQTDEELGRLEVSSIDGDLDGDGDYDRLVSYGGRSFSIRDSKGNIVFDSGEQFAQITAEQVPEIFNSNGTVETFDTRSDAKGAEPEGVVVGEIDGETYAFVGLERTGGVAVYNISDPAEAKFVQYINPIDPETGDALDLAPEGLQFIPGEDSPNGEPLLTVSNEVSGTVSIYQIDLTAPEGETSGSENENNDSGDSPEVEMNEDSRYTLQLLHAADQEAGIPALENADNFSAVLNALREEDADGDGVADYENTVTLSSGDAYIPSPFFAASEIVYGAIGRGDIQIQNELGFEAIALGNHEFDFGTGTVADLISADEDDGYPGTAFPYLSSNLDFSTDEDLAPLVVEDGQQASEIPNSIAGNTIVEVNGEQIGVVGATTPTLPSISSPGDVTVNPIEFDSDNPEDIAALAAEIQTSVDSLLAANPDLNKVVLLAHMQQISIEEALSSQLTNVDVIVGGGSNTLLADDTDRLRTGDEAQGVYPILNTAADGNPIAVVNTDGNYKYVGRLVVDFDENGVIVPESIDPEVSGAYATDAEGVAAVNGTPDPEIDEITDNLSEAIAEQDGNIFGSTEVFLNGIREDVRTQETNLGNLTADANLALAQEVDPDVVISIKNGGGIRDSIGTVIAPPGSTSAEEVERTPTQANEVAGKEAGDISQLDIANSLRFNNGLSLLTVTANELLEIIEHGVAATAEGATPGQFPQVAGIEFSFDPSSASGDRIQSLAIKDAEDNIIDTVVEDGELVGDGGRTFRLVTLGFLADGGDDYPFPDRDRVDLSLEEDAPRTGEATFAPDGTEQDALAEYLVDTYSETPFSMEDVSRELDNRIQNLSLREDTVLSAEDLAESEVGSEILGDSESNAGEGNEDAMTGAVNQIFATSDEDDLISGSEGIDQFWIADSEYPESAKTITNFSSGEDLIGIAGFGIGFEDLSLVQQEYDTLIGAGDQELAILKGVDSTSLSADNFAFG
ncbi:choice-of-anchor I family protein [Pleurocapsales cyanobacterium LEGE 10410]|nr:choice-of-anchor I family protein [Pleurocapsales cyanobacterium LEGE 10410]